MDIMYVCFSIFQEENEMNQKIKPIIFIILSFILITVSLFCLITSMVLQFGLDKEPVPQTTQTPLPPSTVQTQESPTTITKPTESPATTSPETSNIPEGNPTPWKLEQTLDAGINYQNSITFLGDSTTHGMKSYGVLTDGKNTKQIWYGEVGNTITFAYANTVKVIRSSNDTPMLISSAAEKYKPEMLYITLGVTGGVSMNLSEEGFKEIYKILVNSILEKSPDTKIVLQSIYPVAKSLDKAYSKTISNEKIQKANLWIEDICKELYTSGKTVYYLDTYSVLVDDEGYLPENYTNGDGLHLSAAGYNAVLTNIRQHKIPN
jgi:lysophospholipase L1-like esterase